jgi:hypothetical protein
LYLLSIFFFSFKCSLNLGQIWADCKNQGILKDVWNLLQLFCSIEVTDVPINFKRVIYLVYFSCNFYILKLFLNIVCMKTPNREDEVHLY